MENAIKESKYSKLEIFLAIFLIILATLIAYALFINAFGYYSDEWYIVWAGRTSGPGMIVQMHQYDRPLMGYFYALFYVVLGDHPLGWQIFAVVLRLMGVLIFWFTLRMIWPNSLLATTSAALLFAVYPGFMVMPKAIIKVNPLFSLACALISIAFTVKSVQVKRIWQKIVFQVLALGLGITYMFYVEYMIGLEFIRWAFVWVTIKKTDESISNKNRGKLWFLYISAPTFVAIGMMVWRLFYFESGRQAMNVGSITQDFIVSPLRSFVGIFVEMGRDFIESAIYAWSVQGYSMTYGAPYPNWLISISLASLVIIAYILYAYKTKKYSQNDQDFSELSKHFTWIGILGLFAAILPLTIVGRQVYLDSAKFNKYTIHLAISISLMIVGILLIIGNRRRIGLIVVVSILLGLSIQTHYFNGLRYKDDWQYQKDLWWQLTWRAPDLKDKTLLAVRIPTGISISEHYEIWAPANIIYRSDSQEVKITGEIISSETEGWFLRGITNKKTFRGVVPLSRNFNNALILTIPNPASCMHIMDGNRLVDNREDSRVKYIHHTSKIDRIITDTDQNISPPIEIFGSEPGHNWCYYYQKISLAMQRGDFEEAVILADEAARLGYSPRNQSEWIPILETYAEMGRMEDAKAISDELKKNEDLTYLYCNQSWNQNFKEAYALLCADE